MSPFVALLSLVTLLALVAGAPCGPCPALPFDLAYPRRLASLALPVDLRGLAVPGHPWDQGFFPHAARETDNPTSIIARNLMMRPVL